MASVSMSLSAIVIAQRLLLNFCKRRAGLLFSLLFQLLTKIEQREIIEFVHVRVGLREQLPLNESNKST